MNENENNSSAEGNISSAEGNISPADTNDNNGIEKSPEIISVDPVEIIPLTAYDAPPPAEPDAEELEATDEPVSVPAEETAPASDYKKFITSAQEEMKAQLKAELIEELRKELREEIAPKEILKDKVELKFNRKPIENSEPVGNVSKPEIEKTGETRYMFRNTMEDIVAEEVAGILKNEKKMCKCSRCVNDICAIVLNSLTPHYVTSEVAQIYDRAGLLDITKSNNLTVNIFKAIDHVKNKPSHPV